MGSTMISSALLLVLWCACARALSSLTAAGAGDDSDCALYLTGPGRTSAYDYSLNLLKGNFGYEGQHTCITYDAINQAYIEARNRIVVSQPKGDWKPEDFASVGELILDISISLARTYGLTYEEVEKGLPLIDTSKTLIREVCPPVFSHVECRAGKYRRLDGLCNNLQHPTWGATNAPFQRLIGPLFSDGINAPRIAHTGRDLPLSRVVSRTMHPDDGFHDHAGTVMVIAWGQFMDHDYTLTGTPLDPRNRNDPEECCNRPPHLKHPYCNEIRVPDDDYFYRLFGVKCIDFVRGFPSPRPGCRLGSRVPFNTLTGAIDGNTVYGVTDKFSRKLRTGYGGLLRMNPVFKEYGLKDLLPLKLDIPDEGCTRPNKNMYCFEAGEIRVNEQLVLTVMHTLMAREHNRVAVALTAVNPHWDDETLFQEARRINIAEIQHITYNEFLPILLGKDVMEKFGLVLEKQGYWDGYDQNVNPDVIASFASAAYRFGHSLLPTAVERWSKAHKFIASKRLSDLIRRPYDLYRAGVLDEYVMGLMNQVAQAMDDSITQEVTNHLFKKVGARFGMDLVSFNMQRGREFGIPGYMEFRKFCGLSGANSFQDLFGTMSNDTVRKYETIFEHPIDVDLWSGGVSERPLPGSMLGPTFACIIATQFSYSRRGDRFWFELPNQPSSFTPEQLAEIRKSRLARIICDNTDIIDTVQLYPMVLPDHELNPRVPCRSGIIPTMDFTKWAEPVPFHGPAKEFMTDAFLPAKEVNFKKTIDRETQHTNITDINCEDHTVTLNNNCGCNDTAEISNVSQEPNADEILQQSSNKTMADSIQSADLVQDSLKNVEADVDCVENQIKPNQIRDSDAILKYVYKRDDKNNTPDKSKGHVKNSLKRKRRSLDPLIRSTNKKDVENIPLIVNYETSHVPKSTFERNTANVIRGSDLADFNIETLHENIQPDRNSQDNKDKPNKYHYEPKPHQESEESNESGKYKDNKRSNKVSYQENREAYEKPKSQQDSEERKDKEDFQDFKRRSKLNRESEGHERPESLRESEEMDDKVKYGANRRNNKPFRKGENSDERPISRHESVENDDGEEYRTQKNNNKPFREESLERKNSLQENEDSYEREEYRDNRKSSTPYRESNESRERPISRHDSEDDYDREEYQNKKNNKPYRESKENLKRQNSYEEGNESKEYQNNRKNSTPHRDSNESQERPISRHESEEGNDKEEYQDKRIRNKSYPESEESFERPKSHQESEESNDEKEYRDNGRNKKLYSESDDVKKNEYRLRERGTLRGRDSDENQYYIQSKESNDSHESNEKDHLQNNKATYLTLPKDSNESHESSENKLRNEKSAYLILPKGINKSHDSKDVSDFDNPKHENFKDIVDAYPLFEGKKTGEKDYIKSEKLSKENLHEPIDNNNESEEEEAIIAIMRKKNRKPHNKPRDDYKIELTDQYKQRNSSLPPVNIQDVDLRDFSFERIHVNDKGVVEAAKDTHENYESTDSFIEIPTTSKPDTKLKVHDEEFSRSTENIDESLSDEINEDDRRPTHINDGEVKPVVEINSDSSEFKAENDKQALKANANREDTSLETLLGVKELNKEEKNDEIIPQHEEPEKGDVKQQFERIPINYNHNKKQKKNRKSSHPKPPISTPEVENDDVVHNEGTLDILTPKDHHYDENLNIKFDDLTIKLPEIKLPKDILTYAYEEPTYRQNKEAEPKFFQYNDGHSEEESDIQKKRRPNDDDEHDEDHTYHGLYEDDRKKDYTLKHKQRDDDENEHDDEDLYEKFVRERFGKRGSFEKRSEKLQDGRPIEENSKLFNTLQQVLKKTEDIHKQAEKSGDPKAGYLWTLEYGQNA